MNAWTLEDLASRLARLERANLRWRRLATVAFLGLTIVLLTGQVQSRSGPIETEQLTIRDASGRVRVLIKPLEDGATVLTFRDELERDRLAIGVLDNGTPMLSLYDEHRRRRLAVGVFSPDASGLHLYGRDGTPRAALAVRPNDFAALEFNGKDGAARALVTLDDSNPPRLSVLDAKGAPLIQLPPVPQR